jgi:hypothetical protein
VDRLGWAASSTFKVGQWCLGVRSNSTETDSLVRELLRSYLVEDLDGVEPPPNYSVVLHAGDGRGGGTRGLSFLYRSSLAVVRSRSALRVLQGLSTYLGAHELADSGREGLLVIDAVAIVGRRAVLLPSFLRNYMEPGKLGGRLRRGGVTLVDAPMALVDPEAGELIVPPCDLELANDATFAKAARLGPPSDGAPAGRYVLAAWGLMVGEAELGLPMTRGRAVALGMRDVSGPRASIGSSGLPGLTRLFSRVQPLPLSWSMDGALDGLIGLAAG